MSIQDYSERVMRTEEDLKDIHDDLHDIREDFNGFERSMKSDFNMLCKQVSELSTSISLLASTMGERDKQSQIIYEGYKTTFERFGNKIDDIDTRLHIDTKNIDDRVRSLEMANARTQVMTSISKTILVGASSAIGALVMYLLQYVVTSHNN